MGIGIGIGIGLKGCRTFNQYLLSINQSMAKKAKQVSHRNRVSDAVPYAHLPPLAIAVSFTVSYRRLALTESCSLATPE